MLVCFNVWRNYQKYLNETYLVMKFYIITVRFYITKNSREFC